MRSRSQIQGCSERLNLNQALAAVSCAFFRPHLQCSAQPHVFSIGKMRACASNDLTQSHTKGSFLLLDCACVYAVFRQATLCFRLCCGGAQTKFGLFAPARPPKLWGIGRKRAMKAWNLLHNLSIPGDRGFWMGARTGAWWPPDLAPAAVCCPKAVVELGEGFL